MPRFVLLTHDHPEWHWDFMLETPGALRTWRLDHDPRGAATIRGVATPLPDHRTDYLTYEGPVSGGRGHVSRVDAGTYCLVSDTLASVVVDVMGQRLQGQMQLPAGTAGAFEFRRVATT